MTTWVFEPGHTAAEFRARHMMVAWVRGLFKDIHGVLELDWDRCLDATFEGGRFTERTGSTAFKGEVELTIRGVTRTVPLDIHYLGEWKTPWWEGDVNKGEMRRIGFEATARIDRHDFGVSWQDEISGGGVVAGNEIELTLDVEAIELEDLERTGAIEYYRTAEEAGG